MKGGEKMSEMKTPGKAQDVFTILAEEADVMFR
jgi:hypothetical protein